MKIDILTLFPGMFEGVLRESIIKRALEAKLVEIKLHDWRSFTHNKHKMVDDTAYGGGPGMILKPEPIFEVVESLEPGLVILLSPQGQVFNQTKAKELSRERHLILICGHYGGIDERVRIGLVNMELSIGDYVLSGGEIPALVVVDAIVRLLPGALGNSESVKEDSFYESPLLGYPHYTRPVNFRGMKVPEVLLSGHHERIRQWRKQQSLIKTQLNRPDLLEKECK